MNNPSLAQEERPTVGATMTMKAIVRTTYGSPDVLQLEEMTKPTPNDNEVLVRVRAASVNAADWHLLRGKPFLVRLMGYGLLKPKNKVLGGDVAGQVEAVGTGVRRFRPGDVGLRERARWFCRICKRP